MGQDLVWRDGQWLANPSFSEDSVVKRGNNFGELVKHTYRVLLTRGLIGCAIHSTDDQTNRLLKDLGLPNL